MEVWPQAVTQRLRCPLNGRIVEESVSSPSREEQTKTEKLLENSDGQRMDVCYT